MNDFLYDDLIWGDKFKENSGDYSFYKIDDLYNMSEFSNKKIFVSHNGDLPAAESVWRKISPFTCKWYSTNVIFSDINVKPIPIGLENDYVANSVYKKKKLFEYSKYNIGIEKLVYINHNIGTNRIEREEAYTFFKEFKNSSIDHHNLSMDISEYYNRIKKHFFVFSPPGNGIDCHRTWEILYLGRVPIIKDIYHQELFEGLPFVKYKKIEELTEEFLESEKNRILKEYSTFDFNKLKISYWIYKIKQND